MTAMPCSAMMLKCRRDCLHRHNVTEYQDARLAYERGLDAASMDQTLAAEAAAYKAENPGVTFKDWLVGRRRP